MRRDLSGWVVNPSGLLQAFWTIQSPPGFLSNIRGLLQWQSQLYAVLPLSRISVKTEVDVNWLQDFCLTSGKHQPFPGFEFGIEITVVPCFQTNGLASSTILTIAFGLVFVAPLGLPLGTINKTSFLLYLLLPMLVVTAETTTPLFMVTSTVIPVPSPIVAATG
jgi:hypothetical protein